MTMRFSGGEIHRFRRCSGRVLAVVVSLVGAVACTPDAPGSTSLSASGSTSRATLGSTLAAPSGTRSPTASLAEEAGQQATNAYVGMWQAMATAASTSDWRSPLLGMYATGQALNTISRGLYTDHRNGLITKGRPKNEPTVSSVDPSDTPTRVMIRDCGDSTNWLKYHADTGRRADDGLGGRRLITAVVDRQDDGRWLVSDFAVQAVGSC